MTEFIIVWPVLVLLIFGTLQLVLIYLAKSTLNFATVEATRAGALNQARLEQVNLGFVRGMAPLYTTNIRSINQAREKVMDEISDGFVCIERVNPRDPVDFDEHALSTGEIPNDNLMYRDPTPKSGLSIQEANLLKLRITYCYELIVPMMDRLIPGLMRLGGGIPDSPEFSPLLLRDIPSRGGGFSPFERGCLDRGRIPIKAQGILRMQSAAINDRFRKDCG